MNIEFNLVQNILKTLPIGYYLGRNIPVILDPKMDSYYLPEQDKIVIGYALIEKAFVNISEADRDKYSVEEIIRGLLYHEISHVILSPANLKQKASIKYANAINIFEDERIETLLKNFYMNTNFRKNVIILNDFENTKNMQPKTPEQAFFMLVRFHIGSKDLLREVANLISNYKKVTAASSNKNYYLAESYVIDIIKLYERVAREFRYQQMNQQQNRNNSQNNSSNSNSSEQQSSANRSNDSQEQKDQKEQKGQNQSFNSYDSLDDVSEDKSSSNKSEKNEKSESTDTNQTSTQAGSDSFEADQEEDIDIPSIPKVDDLTDEQVSEMVKEFNNLLSDEEVKHLVQNAIKEVVNKYFDPTLTTKLSQIILEKLKQKNKNGAAINSYSGRLDVRSIARRDDYKWWSQQNRAGHIRMYSKVHFNLFIDNSGSFKSNDENMNKFIQSLIKIIGQDFDFDVITINTQIVEWDSPKQKLFKSGGGTCLKRKIKDVIKRHTVPHANNYNIVLFDGDADPDLLDNGSNAFSFFDSPNTIIVTDSSNKIYIERANITKARVIITYDYCNKFIGAVLDLMAQTI